MAGWEIRVEITYFVPGGSGEILSSSYSPDGCFQGGYSHRFDSGGILVLVHADGELVLGGGWMGFEIEKFNVVKIAPCCPPGWMRCKNANGTYCCLPCDEIKNSIKSITESLRDTK